MAWANSLLLALICHVIVFSLVTVAFHVVPNNSGLEFFFWGGIVRKEELTPGRSSSWDFSDGGVVSLPQSTNVYSLIWNKAVALDKPEKRRLQGDSVLPEPLKFLGPRVTLDDGREQKGESRPVELPSPPRVRLRYPRS